MKTPSLLWHSAQLGWLGCQFHAPAALYPKGNPLVLISVRGWVDHTAKECRQKESVTWNFLRTLLGIEPPELPVLGRIASTNLATQQPIKIHAFEVPTSLCNLTMCRLVEIYRSFGRKTAVIFRTEYWRYVTLLTAVWFELGGSNR